MPYLMSLEGPQLGRLDALRSELYDTAPKSLVRASAKLQGFFDPVTVPVAAHPWFALLGLLAGAWYYNSKHRRR